MAYDNIIVATRGRAGLITLGGGAPREGLHERACGGGKVLGLWFRYVKEIE
jgi:hypothetical protein